MGRRRGGGGGGVRGGMTRSLSIKTILEKNFATHSFSCTFPITDYVTFPVELLF